MHIEHIASGETVATVTQAAGDFEAAKAQALRIALSVCPAGRKPVWCGPRNWADGALGGWDVPSADGDWGAEVVCIYP